MTNSYKVPLKIRRDYRKKRNKHNSYQKTTCLLKKNLANFINLFFLKKKNQADYLTVFYVGTVILICIEFTNM